MDAKTIKSLVEAAPKLAAAGVSRFELSETGAVRIEFGGSAACLTADSPSDKSTIDVLRREVSSDDDAGENNERERGSSDDDEIDLDTAHL